MIGEYFRARKRKETAKKVAVGSIFGAAIGSIAGVLLAPKSGEETRKDISDSVNEVTDTVKATVNEGVERTREMQDQFVTEVKDVLDKVKEDEDQESIAIEDSESKEKKDKKEKEKKDDKDDKDDKDKKKEKKK